MMDQNRVCISIIIPCYNIATHVSQCIESVLSQTYTDFELLLINDGSTDDTLQICEQFAAKDARVAVYTHANRGVSYTRNRGIDLAQGDYIMFIDGDDWVEANMLELLLQSIDINTTPVSGMIHERKGKVFENDFFKNLIVTRQLDYDGNTVHNLFPSSVLSSPCCKLYNRSILIDYNIKFEEHLSYQEDLIFNLNYLRYVPKITIVPAFSYHYVEHETSSSSRFHPHLDQSVTQVHQLLEYLFTTHSKTKSFLHFNLSQVLKLVSNYLHEKSGLTFKAKIQAINGVFKYSIFKESRHFIPELEIGVLLRYFMKHESAYGILFYFEFHKLLIRLKKK
jgi:glycosyltransferase involved in cell wall biosynthesis